MEIDELRIRAEQLFPAAVKWAIANPGAENSAYKELHGLCWTHHKNLGFVCQADCFDDVVPKLEGTLSLEAWSRADIEIHGWLLNVRLKVFYLGGAYAHFELRHDGPLPGVTETGYRSVFIPLSQLGDKSPLEYLSEAILPRPREQQLTLF